MFQSMASFVGNITVVINYDCERAEEFTESLWAALTAMGHYALAYAASNTRFRVPEKEMQEIFDSRGLDGEHLLSFQTKETATLMYNAILATLQNEFEMEGTGCLKKSFDSRRFVKVATDLENLNAGVLRVISSMSSNKLPFSYHQLINWGVRNGFVLTSIARYWFMAIAHASKGRDYPFSCFQTMFSIHHDYYTCPTEEVIWFNVYRILLAYFVLGCLELYPTLAKTWEHSLVLNNYRGVVDCICRPLKPGTERRSLDQLRLDRGDQLLEKEMATARNQDSGDIQLSIRSLSETELSTTDSAYLPPHLP